VHGTAPLVDSVATFDEATGRAAVFLVNRSLSDALTIEVDVAGLAVSEVLEAVGIHDEDVYAKNTIEDRERVGLTPNASATLVDGTLTITLPPVSWTAVSLG
jgi:alpha-N-arabinofuranosidase